MSNCVFIITSVIENALYSSFDPVTRIQHTLQTIGSIMEYAKGSTMIICEGSEFKWPLIENVHVLYCNVLELNKNAGEAALTMHALQSDLLKTLIDEHGIKRIFKISGRYVLTPKFDIQQHMNTDREDKIVIKRNPSNEEGFFCTITVLYSFPVCLIAYILECLQRAKEGGVITNIEHELFGNTTLDLALFHLIPEIGVEGYNAPWCKYWTG